MATQEIYQGMLFKVPSDKLRPNRIYKIEAIGADNVKISFKRDNSDRQVVYYSVESVKKYFSNGTYVEQEVKVIVNNSCILDSIEKACLYITSPTGKTLVWKKHKLMVTEDKESIELFWRLVGDQFVRFIGPVNVTVREMQLIKLNCSK